jgi:hypothetical protein
MGVRRGCLSTNIVFGQWEDMMGWKRVGYQGLDRDACLPQWKAIMGSVEERTSGVGVFKSEENSLSHAAARMYAAEAIEWIEEELALPVDAYRRPEAPWF